MNNTQHSPSLIPVSLKGSDEALLIEWRDGVTHTLKWTLLRERCPCATCRTKRTEPAAEEPLLQVISTAEAQPAKATRMEPMGNYAYGIAFNDGHDSGIYSLEFLRQLGEETTT